MSSHSTSPSPRPFSLWSTAALSFLALSTLTSFTSAAPAKHTLAPENLVSAMSLEFSNTSPLPLQLQIESKARGLQKLAYLPTKGPSLDFYYLNYRTTYHANSPTNAGIIDFWMLTPEGGQAPATGSLELFDEFGKIRLATLVEEGTEIPKEVANRYQPFLWKSWKIPKTLQADFDFSESFRVVLKTSDHIAAAKEAAAKKAAAAATAINNSNNNNNNKQAKKNGKRQYDDTELVNFLLVKNKNKHVTSADNASTLESMGAGNMVVQDRQFRIKGLAASPGGRPNPAMLTFNSLIAPPRSNANNTPKTTIDDKSNSPTTPSTNDNVQSKEGDKSSNNENNFLATGTRSAAASLAAHLPQFTALLVVVFAATMGTSFL